MDWILNSTPDRLLMIGVLIAMLAPKLKPVWDLFLKWKGMTPATPPANPADPSVPSVPSVPNDKPILKLIYDLLATKDPAKVSAALEVIDCHCGHVHEPATK